LSKKDDQQNRGLGDEFKQLQWKIYSKTTGMVLGATLTVLVIYALFFRGHIADTMIYLIQLFSHKDYKEAKEVYKSVFRTNNVFYIVLMILILFFCVLRKYLKSFTKYFVEINEGINSLVDENTEDIHLSEGLEATERKINSIRHTLAQRKMTTELEVKRKNELIVYLAHDLKTPLTSVIGYLNLLRDEKEITQEDREKYLDISLEKAERLEELINEFFEITRFNVSGISLECSRVNLTRMLEQITYEFKPQLAGRQLQCIFENDKDIFVNCDANKLQRVFDNLLRNAVNYSYEKEMIRVCVKQEDGYASILFANRGEEIPGEKLEHIFEQFYRVDTARNTKSGGAGLGLAIAKEIVNAHGGTITAESAGELIKFEVKIPAL